MARNVVFWLMFVTFLIQSTTHRFCGVAARKLSPAERARARVARHRQQDEVRKSSPPVTERGNSLETKATTLPAGNTQRNNVEDRAQRSHSTIRSQMHDSNPQKDSHDASLKEKSSELCRSICDGDKKRNEALLEDITALTLELEERDNVISTLRSESNALEKRFSDLQRKHAIMRAEGVALTEANRKLRYQNEAIKQIHDVHHSCLDGSRTAIEELEALQLLHDECETNFLEEKTIAAEREERVQQLSGEVQSAFSELAAVSRTKKEMETNIERHKRRTKQLEQQLKSIDQRYRGSKAEEMVQRKHAATLDELLQKTNASYEICRHNVTFLDDLRHSAMHNFENCTIRLEAAIAYSNERTSRHEICEEKVYKLEKTIKELQFQTNATKHNFEECQNASSSQIQYNIKTRQEWESVAQTFHDKLRVCVNDLYHQNMVQKSSPFTATCRELDTFFKELTAMLTAHSHHESRNHNYTLVNGTSIDSAGFSGSSDKNDGNELDNDQIVGLPPPGIDLAGMSSTALASKMKNTWQKLVLQTNVQQQEIKHLRRVVQQLMSE